MNATGSQSMHREVEGVLNLFELPIGLVDLADFTVVAASSAMLRLLGLSVHEVVGHRVTELYTPEDGAAAIAALSILRDGVVDFYRSERQLDARFKRAAKVTAWGRSVTLGDRHFALVELSDGAARAGTRFAGYFGGDLPVMALGTASSDWVITSMSSDSVELLGTAPEELIGQNLLSLVAPEDVAGLEAAERMVNEDMSPAAKAVRMRDKNSGGWRALYCVLTELSVSDNRYFMLIPVEQGRDGSVATATTQTPTTGAPTTATTQATPTTQTTPTTPTPTPTPTVEQGSGSPEDSASRVAELERHLWRIAAEVEASGVLRQVREGPDLSSLSELGSLSTKQWEVLSRLLQGKRVRTIAKEMFISESTVRNHLSAIFERFGVHSQAELLALLRNPTPAPAESKPPPPPPPAPPPS